MVSIVVPVYNTENSLARCLESIARQAYKDFECIVVDDGSNDKSLFIAREYESKDSRFRIFHKENGGVSSARNYGIERVRGEYLYFVDSDDELYEDALYVLLDQMKDGVDLVFGGFVRCDDDGKMLYSTEGKVPFTTTVKGAMDLVAYPTKYYHTLGMTWQNLFKKDIILKNNLRYGEEHGNVEDLAFLVSYLCVCQSNVAFTTQPIYKYYCQQSDSIMNTRYKEFKVNTLNTLDGRIAVLDASRRFGKSRKMIYQAQLAVFCTYHDLVSYVRRFNHPELEPKLKRKVDSVLSSPVYMGLTIRDRIKRIVKKMA